MRPTRLFDNHNGLPRCARNDSSPAIAMTAPPLRHREAAGRGDPGVGPGLGRGDWVLMLLRGTVVMRLWRPMLLAATLAMPPAWAQSSNAPPLPQLLQLAGTHAGETAPDAMHLATSASAGRQFPLYRAVMARPLQAPYRVGMLAHEFRHVAASPHDLLTLAGTVAGLALARSPAQALEPIEARLRAAVDPLASSVAWMAPMAKAGSRWSQKFDTFSRKFRFPRPDLPINSSTYDDFQTEIEKLL